jgi:hypothetical protein
MAADIPPRAMQYLKYLPTIANWIQTDKRISTIEMGFFKIFFSEPYRLLKSTTYEQISDIISPYQNDPRFGDYVRTALSSQGEAWLRYAIDLVHRS